MAMNAEFQRHIDNETARGNMAGATALQRQRDIFNRAVHAGLVQELPVQTMKTEDEFTALRSLPLGRLIEHFRRDAHLSLRQFARNASLDATYLSRLEQGRYSAPKLSTVVRIVESFGWEAGDPRATMLVSRAIKDALTQRRSPR